MGPYGDFAGAPGVLYALVFFGASVCGFRKESALTRSLRCAKPVYAPATPKTSKGRSLMLKNLSARLYPSKDARPMSASGRLRPVSDALLLDRWGSSLGRIGRRVWPLEVAGVVQASGCTHLLRW